MEKSKEQFFKQAQTENFGYFKCHYIAEMITDSVIPPDYERPKFYLNGSSFTIPYNTEIRLETFDDQFSLYNDEWADLYAKELYNRYF